MDNQYRQFLSTLTVPSPIQEIKNDKILLAHNIKLSIKREDLIHPEVSGNKWRKLKYNLLESISNGRQGIVTYGGAFSNHIHATAAACHAANIPSVGIIRGESDESNPTTTFARSRGMKLHYVSRAAYRMKEESEEVRGIISQYPDYILVPEGGSNELSYRGLRELADEISSSNKGYDLITVSAGTGATASGIIKYQTKDVLVFSALKSDYLQAEITKLSGKSSFKFSNEYHFGGYGKTDDSLVSFINTFQSQHQIPLDPIYNGKTVFGIYDLIKKGMIAPNTSILHLHTGGLQGVVAYNYMAKKKGRKMIV